MNRSLLIALNIGLGFVCLQGCHKLELYEGENIVACNQTNPLYNIEWLNAYSQSIRETQGVSSVIISLYRHREYDEFYFESVVVKKKKRYFEYRDCDGNVVFECVRPVSKPRSQCVSEAPPSFLGDKVLIAELLRYIK